LLIESQSDFGYRVQQSVLDVKTLKTPLFVSAEAVSLNYFSLVLK